MEHRENHKKAHTKKLYSVSIYYDWCKACGICAAFCPAGILHLDSVGKPYVEDSDRCVGCRFCELHCPDFAITVMPRNPRRRKSDI